MRHSALGIRDSAGALLLGAALTLIAARPARAQPTLAGARAGAEVAGVSAAPPPAADTLRSSRGQRIAVIVGSGYLWSVGAFIGLVAVVGGECFENCGPRPSRFAAMSGAALGGGATIAFSMAGLGEGAYRRCSFRARLARSAAGVALGSAPGALHAALDPGAVTPVYVMGAGQLLGSVVALRPCR